MYYHLWLSLSLNHNIFSDLQHTGQQSRYDVLYKELAEMTEERNEALKKIETSKDDLTQQAHLAKDVSYYVVITE